MNLRQKKELASNVLGVGMTRVSMNLERLGDISQAITREDIRGLVSEGAIIIKPKKGISRGRWRAIAIQKKKGKRKGPGHRKGTKNARFPKKKRWMSKIRAIRDELKKLRGERKIEEGSYQKLYLQAKGNLFHSRRHLREHVKKSKE